MVDFEQFCDAIEGTRCLDLIAQEYWYRGERVSLVNVLFLQFGEARWARLGIDAGDFHWREVAVVEKIEEPYVEFDCPLRNLGAEFPVIGQRIQHVSMKRFGPLHVVVYIAFDSGASLELINLDDRTELQFRAVAV